MQNPKHGSGPLASWACRGLTRYLNTLCTHLLWLPIIMWSASQIWWARIYDMESHILMPPWGPCSAWSVWQQYRITKCPGMLECSKRGGARIFLDTVKLWCTFKVLYHVWKSSAVQELWSHLGAMISVGLPDQAYLKIVTHLQSDNWRSCILPVVYRLATLWDPELKLTSPRHPVNWISSRAWLYRYPSWIGKTIAHVQKNGITLLAPFTTYKYNKSWGSSTSRNVRTHIRRFLDRGKLLISIDQSEMGRRTVQWLARFKPTVRVLYRQFNQDDSSFWDTWPLELWAWLETLWGVTPLSRIAILDL